jgi:uroporphyrinogen-III synthase
MRVLVFRPLEDAERSAQSLRERGKDPVVAPLGRT